MNDDIYALQDKFYDQLDAAHVRIAELNTRVFEAETANQEIAADLALAQIRIAELEAQVAAKRIEPHMAILQATRGDTLWA